VNIWQVVNQMQSLLQAAVWPGSSTPIFAPESVVVATTESDMDVLDAHTVLPLAVIALGGGSADPSFRDEPGYWEHQIELVLAVRNFGDRKGEAPVMGSARESTTDSRGRGVLEILAPVLETLELLNVQDGITVACVAQGEPATRRDQSDGTVYALQALSFTVSCAREAYYPAPRRLVATPTSGDVALSWENPPARFDRLRVVLRRATGGVAPASPSAGTGVTLASDFATSVVDVVAAGTYSYALFMVYDEFSRGANNVAAPTTMNRYSDAAEETGVVVP
jgi:hypothetical protein